MDINVQLLNVTCGAGNGLFLGNSMPIRDMDMYADSNQSHAAEGLSQGQVPLS